jgi:hypothetical protein
MRLAIDPEGVARNLPDLDDLLEDPRLRPMGVLGGTGALALAALLQVFPVEPFWRAVVGGVLAFVGAPLLAIGLAAPEPAGENAHSRLGVNMTYIQRRVVAAGALLVLTSPMLVAVVGPMTGFADWVWLGGAMVAFLGAVLILTGFVAWSSKAIAEPSSMQ